MNWTTDPKWPQKGLVPKSTKSEGVDQIGLTLGWVREHVSMAMLVTTVKLYIIESPNSVGSETV